MQAVVQGVNFSSALFTGLAAGYAMAFTGYWVEGLLGLPRVDLRDIGRIWVGQDGPSTWWAGLFIQAVESVLLAIAYAALFYRRLPGPPWLRGLTFGLLLWIAGIAVTLVGKAAGGRVFRTFVLSRSYVAGNFLQHVVYGLVLGALYFDPAFVQ